MPALDSILALPLTPAIHPILALPVLDPILALTLTLALDSIPTLTLTHTKPQNSRYKMRVRVESESGCLP